jgi:alkyl hydroperoxide reductase subunit AhpC
MVETSKRIGFAFPYLQDSHQKVARAYDAACTPEAFLFDHELRLQYHGQPDILNQQETSVENSALIRAIDAVLFGHKPQVRYTGCCGSSIKWKQELVA